MKIFGFVHLNRLWEMVVVLWLMDVMLEVEGSSCLCRKNDEAERKKKRTKNMQKGQEAL